MNCFTGVYSHVVDFYWCLADNLSLLHEAAEGQGAPETLLHTGGKNTLPDSPLNILYTKSLDIDMCVCDHSEYWHPGACGRPRGRGSNWSSRNILHIPLCQLLLPQGVQPGLDERCLLLLLTFACNNKSLGLLRCFLFFFLVVWDFNLLLLPCRKNLFWWHSQMWQM